MDVITGRGGLPMVQIQTAWSAAEIYLQGASVTHFQKHGEPPLLFLSEKSRFEKDAPIRGGIPIIFPWFGKPEGKTTQHGFARVRPWELVEIAKQADGRVIAHFSLPVSAELLTIPLDYYVTVSKTLTAELVVRNYSDREFVFENCLHTYFTVGDIARVKVHGLQGVDYLDALEGRARRQETSEFIRFTGEVDRLYINTHTLWRSAMLPCSEPFLWKKKVQLRLWSGIRGSRKQKPWRTSAMRNTNAWSASNPATRR
jgi:glucose-6-phosphate 1-epimerase